jgi:alkylation response protein AidB-like acyl-CoA dehydrogenase
MPMVTQTSAATRSVPASVGQLRDRRQALEAVREILPRIRARARQTDADRLVPAETVNELMAAGLFGVLTPKSFGGSDLGLATLVDVTVEIAACCGSSGWVYGVLAGHSWLLNMFPYEAQQEVLGTHQLAATVFRLAGDVREEKGGYRLTGGEGRFCSGIDHAKWVVIGNAVLRDGQPPDPTFFVIPRSDISEVVDDWYVAGMRGTGSKTIKVPNAFIPAHRAVRVSAMSAGTAPGAQHHHNPMLKFPWNLIAPFSLIGVPLGVARAGVTAFAESLRKPMADFTPERIAEQSATFARLAVARADIDAAYSSVIDNARRLDTAKELADLSADEQARIPRDWAYAAQRSRQCVNNLFEVAGGSATYDFSDLQRIWRDANAAAQHVAFSWDSAMTAYGRSLVGVAAPKFGPKGR